jgi:hypothetical protein
VKALGLILGQGQPSDARRSWPGLCSRECIVAPSHAARGFLSRSVQPGYERYNGTCLCGDDWSGAEPLSGAAPADGVLVGVVTNASYEMERMRITATYGDASPHAVGHEVAVASAPVIWSMSTRHSSYLCISTMQPSAAMVVNRYSRP